MMAEAGKLPILPNAMTLFSRVEAGQVQTGRKDNKRVGFGDTGLVSSV